MKSLISKNRYIILISVTAIQCCTSFPMIWSIFQERAANTYGISLQESGTILTMCIAFFSMFYLIGGRLQDTIGPRFTAILGSLCMSGAMFSLYLLPDKITYLTLVLLYALPFGGGCGLILSGGSNALYKWYADKKGFASGFAAAVSAGSLILFIQVSQKLAEVYEFRQIMFFYAIGFLVVSLSCSLTFVNPSREYIEEKNSLAFAVGGQKKEIVDFSPKQVLKTKQFYQLFFAAFFASPIYTLIVGSVVTLAISKGLSIEMATLTVSVATASSALGKFIVPTISDKIGRKNTSVIFSSLVVVSSVCLFIFEGFLFIVVYSAFMFIHGGWGMLITPYSNDMFGFKYAGVNSGLITFHSLLAAFSFTALSMALVPMFGDNTNFFIGIPCAFIAALLVFSLNPKVELPAN